ncbi:2,3-bisphosphoglycerate-independent phosphoglycerate mutase [Coemansia aciculifera]|uniref:2,3-bisphosphoglycerate-independent phosphoglycerate mutase n=1 Tax=Coemansia aciculifera TaxID=417176 RepID=A0ACC1LYG4_9FUNG|nr:2,3-bisphosphoglycerate-independent phosphoglycerate mutase [Coemansia aciculifera]
MSSAEVADKVAEEIGKNKYPFVMCNFAPPDMVGHTGLYDAAVEAIAATDRAIGAIYEACKEHGYALFVTADHGNAEKMLSDDGLSPHTAHTCSRVPFAMAVPEESDAKFVAEDSKHALCDVAPTLLAYMGLDIPENMTGHSLLQQ